MWTDRVSNPGPLTYESGALPIALCGPAHVCVCSSSFFVLFCCLFFLGGGGGGGLANFRGKNLLSLDSKFFHLR